MTDLYDRDRSLNVTIHNLAIAFSEVRAALEHWDRDALDVALVAIINSAKQARTTLAQQPVKCND